MPINKAISYIEENLEHPVSLKDLAEIAGLSPYYFSRLFRALTGQSAINYLRLRRLTLAAQKLETKDNISLVDLALDYGFDSQQAFTRAFKRNFGVPPGKYRSLGLSLCSAYQFSLKSNHIAGQKTLPSNINLEPQIKSKAEFFIVGMEEDLDKNDTSNIPVLWQSFLGRLHEIRYISEAGAVGACFRSKEDTATYIAAFETANIDEIPVGMTGKLIPANTYAIFTIKLDGNQSRTDRLTAAYQEIWCTWLPNSAYIFTEDPDFIYFDPRFHLNDGIGEFHIHLPIREKTNP